MPGLRAVLPSRPAPPERTLLDVFTATVRAHPDAPAIDDSGAVRDYATLARDVEALRSRLQAVGVGTGDRVGIRVPGGSADVYVALLAVLASGAAYVPVDADDPDERAALVWAEAGVCAVIGAGHVLMLPPDVLPRGESRPPSPDDDAWIIFTSGTTGKPKGVAVSHRSGAALADAEARLFLQEQPLGPGDRVLGCLSVAFDASCEEMWLAWRHGACLVPAPRELVRSGADLCPWMVERGVTAISTVPTLAALWPTDALAGVRLLILGGETFSQAMAERLLSGGREVWNTYGPTEATVVACLAQLRQGEPPRIGWALDGWDLAVVDPDGEPVAWGEVGELVIGGVGVARYLDPANEVGRFEPMPRLGWPRGYRSGDLVLADRAGLVFVGRRDGQLKIRGHRLEPGEISNALEAHPGVRQAHVRAVDGNRDGDRDGDGPQLVAYVVLEAGPAGVTVPELRRHLVERLPAYMRPDHYVPLDVMPVTVSGKIDARALPTPAAHPAARPDPAAAGSPASMEELVAEVWGEVLGLDAGDVGLDDRFLEIGGNSLMVPRVSERLADALGRPIPVVELFGHPTVRSLAEHLQAGAPAAAPVPLRRRRVRPSGRTRTSIAAGSPTEDGHS
jgi:amino acid adenylation domain-containing protein